ncbi:Nn.00g097270.m01.CDS01 [Neocucurbitaria sp. VM-36]
MAATKAMADRHIVSSILHHLSDMKYKDRRQQGPDQPVEFMEFRPTLVPSILVNKLWAEEGTSILWKGYPHLPALKTMSPDRRQWYANKVERLFVLGPSLDSRENLAYLEGLVWPSLKNLELEIDWKTHGNSFEAMLHGGLEHLEFSGSQTGDSKFVVEVLLPTLFAPCKNLQGVYFSSDAIDPRDPVNAYDLSDILGSIPNVKDIRIMNTNFLGKDLLFGRLSQRPGLRALEIDLDPGLQLLPLLCGPNALPSPFASLKHLHVMCYPEIACALPVHLRRVEIFHLDVARIPNQPFLDSDISVLDDLLHALSQCPELRVLRINIGPLALDFPSPSSYPLLSGPALITLATGCSKLRELNLLASEPATIDGSMISSIQFDEFCRKASHLEELSLKFHPGTVIALETVALQSLGKHCPRLEALRLKIALHLPDLPRLDMASQMDTIRAAGTPPQGHNDNLDPPAITINGQTQENYPTTIVSSDKPLFPRLTHLALARPQSILSIANDTYTISSTSQSSSIVDPSLEEDLVRTWAQYLLDNFPGLDILEAWGDWTGQDNESLNYFLPLEEILASTWEFLSGVEQDLWEDGVDLEVHGDHVEEWGEELEEHISLDSHGSGDDWEKASLINEFPVQEVGDDREYLEVYEEEPEGTITPGRTLDKENEGYFEHAEKHTG